MLRVVQVDCVIVVLVYCIGYGILRSYLRISKILVSNLVVRFGFSLGFWG